MKFHLLLLLLLVSSACGHDREQSPSYLHYGDGQVVAEGSSDQAADSEAAFTLTRRNSFNPATKAFVVAGGGDIANFGNEVVDIMEELKRRGLPEDQIACYFAVPFRDAYERDKTQYDAISAKLSKCYLASVGSLKQHLKLVEKESDVFFYFYLPRHAAISCFNRS